MGRKTSTDRAGQPVSATPARSSGDPSGKGAVSVPTAEEAEESPAGRLLPGIHSPADVRALPEGTMPRLCGEIRRVLIDTVSVTGGHLASNLGVVELTVAMHRVFDCPHDHFIFDVGHQSYVHKLLTGRQEQFGSLRQGGGISGFTKRDESVYDCFGAGHSSTSLSAALGFAQGDRLAGSDAYTVAVVGDGAFTGGMIHEALNNVVKGLRLVVILNENEMSISRNIGRFADRLAKLRLKKSYFRTKRATVRFIKKIPLVGERMFRAARDVKKFFKNAVYGSNYFEDLGIYYLGPADGNDYEAVETLLTEAKKLNDCVVIHLKTRKGKGYPPAENDPGYYHSTPPKGKVRQENFSHRFGQLLLEKGREDPKICAITAGMSDGTGLEAFHTAFPGRFFDVGIAEEHALTFAAGLAADGFHPVTAVYSTFMQRAYDQIIHDIALQRLPVVMCIDRAGLNGADGATHHGLFDVAFLSSIPHITIFTPATFAGLERALTAALSCEGPSVVRYPNAPDNDIVRQVFYGETTPPGIGVRTTFDPSDRTVEAVIMTHGAMASEAVEAREILRKEGIHVGLLLAEYLKPYDRLSAETARLLPENGAPVLFAEEEIRAGGFGMMLSDALRRDGVFRDRHFDIAAVEDHFVIQTRRESIRHTAGVDAVCLAERVRTLVADR